MKKRGWVQSDTAKLEQSEELLCQVNDRRVERKSTCPHFHPWLISPAQFLSVSLDFFSLSLNLILPTFCSLYCFFPLLSPFFILPCMSLLQFQTLSTIILNNQVVQEHPNCFFSTKFSPHTFKYIYIYINVQKSWDNFKLFTFCFHWARVSSIF